MRSSRTAFGADYAEEDWQNALGGWHVVVVEHDRVVAHASVVPRTIEVGDRAFRTGYVESVATAPDRERLGLGSRAMTVITDIVRDQFELGALSTGRHDFYALARLGALAGPDVRAGRNAPEAYRGRRRRPHGPPLRPERASRPHRADHLRVPPRRRLVTAREWVKKAP